MAIYSNLTIDQGSPFSVTITVNDDTGNVKNLTGFTYAAKAKRSYDSETPSATFITSDTLGANGQLTITLTDVITKAMAPGIHVYDVEIIDSGGNCTRVVEGQIEVTPGVTLGAS
tara:strand:+ start:426 stop:770 length:345 start_codon:yes stop_codon:yes gene_type:complete